MKQALSSQANNEDSVILRPMHRLPIMIFLSGLILLFLPINTHWPTFLISGFGLFLLLQSFTLKLEFTKNDLVVLQLGKELRRFPFKNWIAWKIILPQLPGFFYFREEASPHLLPILFDPNMLKEQLKIHVNSLEV